MFPLAIFPVGALDSSVITTVWVGVMVVATFNLRLGWVLSGLVVPGYIVPLLLVKPLAAGVTLVEGIVTYGLVWFYSEYLSRVTGWSNLFGRDRFFALVLASVAVRLVGDGWLLPELAQYLTDHFQFKYDYRNNLHSFGLIIVALIANNFWKTGLRAGLPPMLVTIGLTFVIVRFGLMEWTNFSIGNLSYMYEDVAASIMASPKSYIILLSTAFLASRLNLHYGWDFSGILIPSLLALQWYQPFKILTSFAEALIIVALAVLALRMPVFQRVTMEGARKLMLFFNISFLYKMALGFAISFAAPGAMAVDYFGFGYLLPTLIAIKMHDKGILIRLTRATLQTSLLAVAGASLVGFALTFLPPFGWWTVPVPARATPPPVMPNADAPLIDVIRADKLDMYANRLRDGGVTPTPAEVATFSRALTELAAALDAPASPALDAAIATLDPLGYTVTERDQYLYLAERAPRRGWGSYVLNRNAGSPLVIEVPAPFEETGTLEAAGAAFIRLQARGLAVNGAPRRRGVDGAGDVLANPQHFFQAFHQVFGRAGALQVRAETVLPQTAAASRPSGPSLWVHGSLPAGLDLPALKTLSGPFEVRFDAPALRNVQRAAQREGFAELFADRASLRRIQTRALVDDAVVRAQEQDRQIDGYLQDWLLGDTREIAAAGSGLYVVPRREQLLFFDEEVLTPLLALANQAYTATGWTAEGLEQLHEINRAARTLNYEVIRYRQRNTTTDYLILAERPQATPRHYWGTFVLRLGASEPYVVQVPRPLFETNSFELAVALYARLDARYLLVAGAHPNANADGTADLVRYKNRMNAFNLVNQVVLREAGDVPMMVVQSRAFGVRPEVPTPAADILLAFDQGTSRAASASPLGRQLSRLLDEDGFTQRFVSGRPDQVGYEIGGLPQVQYLQATRHKEFVIAWVSPAARRAYRQQGDNRALAQQFEALEIPSTTAPLHEYLADTAFAAPPSPSLRERVMRYQQTQDIIALRAIADVAPRYRLERVLDLNSRQAFLLLRDARGQPVLVANVAPRDLDRHETFATATEFSAALARFVDARAGTLSRGSP